MKRRTALLGLATLAACASAPPRLHSLAPSLGSGGAPVSLTIGLEPIDVAAVASRRELVLRPTPTAVTLTERDLWAEPLDAMVQRVLAEDLARALVVDQVTRLPSRHPIALDRVVDVRIVDLEGRADGIARLTAVWTIFAGQPLRPVRRGRTEAEERYAPADDATALVLALNRAVARLALDLAAALRTPI